MSIDNATRKAVMLAWGWRCFYCGHKAEEIDHVVPVTKGGSDEAHNLVAACKECNRMKKSNWLPLSVLTEALHAAQQYRHFVETAADVYRSAQRLADERIKYGSLPLFEGMPPVAMVKPGERVLHAARDVGKAARHVANIHGVLSGNDLANVIVDRQEPPAEAGGEC